MTYIPNGDQRTPYRKFATRLDYLLIYIALVPSFTSPFSTALYIRSHSHHRYDLCFPHACLLRDIPVLHFLEVIGFWLVFRDLVSKSDIKGIHVRGCELASGRFHFEQ